LNKINSSDDYRTDKFSNYIEEFKIPFTLELDRGGKLNDVVIAYETYGNLEINYAILSVMHTGDLM